jgi:hypothetical protein
MQRYRGSQVAGRERSLLLSSYVRMDASRTLDLIL